MKIHVLPGDAQAETFMETGIEGEIIVCRECLIEGPVKAANLEEFWQIRAEFLDNAGEGFYVEKVATQLGKLIDLAPGTEINLWFEYELFCQANMWFCLSLLRDTGAEVYRIAPVVRKEEEVWKGFGNLSAVDLQECFSNRTKFENSDILLGADLWDAYANGDHKKITELSGSTSDCFPRLKEVCEAEIEKSVRPKQILTGLIESGLTDFKDIFPAFAARAGVYGFGDSQVKNILAEI